MGKDKAKTLSRKAQGEETRANLLAIGARLFALHGYHGVSIRMLAAESGVNLATVSYHFGGKPGLYETILQNMIDIRNDLFPTADDIRERLAETGDGIQARSDCVDWFIDALVQGILGNKQYKWPAFIISRELAQPTELFPKLQDEFFTPAFSSLYTFAELMLPEGTDHEELVITAHSVIGMIVKFLEGIDIITQRLGWKDYEGYGADKISAVLCNRFKGFLGLPMENIQ